MDSNSPFFGPLKGPIGLFPLLARSAATRDRNAIFLRRVVDRPVRYSSLLMEGLSLDRNETDRSRSKAPAPSLKGKGTTSRPTERRSGETSQTFTWETHALHSPP